MVRSNVLNPLRLKKVTLAVMAIGLVFSGVGAAKLRAIAWETELCSVRAVYDDARISAAQLHNTQRMIAEGGAAAIYDFRHPLADDQSEYEQIDAKLREPKNYAPDQAVQQLRELTRAQNDFFYQAEQIKRKAQQTRDYAVLRQFNHTPACEPIVQALQARGTDKWRRAYPMLLKSCRDNADPKGCVARSESAWRKSEQAINDELLWYHWSNCANRAQPHISYQHIRAAQRAFNAYVRQVRETCDEP